MLALGSAGVLVVTLRVYLGVLIPITRAGFSARRLSGDFMAGQSKSARRRARRRGAGGGAIMMAMTRLPGLTDWKIGGSNVDSTGTPLTTTTTWNLGAPLAIVSGTPMSFQAAIIQPAVSTSTPLVGAMRIDEIRGSVGIESIAAAGSVRLAVCVYVSQYSSSGPKWDVRDPLNTADAARDDYLFMEGHVFEACQTGASVADTPACEVAIHIQMPVIIGAGQAVQVTVSYVHSAAAAAKVWSAFRTRIGPVA